MALQIQQPDSDFVSLKREYSYPFGGNYYIITVSSTGTVEYIHKTNQYIDTMYYSVSKDSVNYLFRKIEGIGFFALRSSTFWEK